MGVELSAPVGGPLVMLRAEAVRLLCLLQQVKSHRDFHHAIQLLVFVDCSVLLLLLQKWGQSNFWPDPRDVIHFDALFTFPRNTSMDRAVRALNTGQNQESP